MAKKRDFSSKIDFADTAVIANGQTDSGEIDVVGLSLTGIIVPSAFTGSSITFKTSDVSGGTFLPLHDTSGLISCNITVDTVKLFDDRMFQSLRFIKIVGSAQGAERTIKLILS